MGEFLNLRCQFNSNSYYYAHISKYLIQMLIHKIKLLRRSLYMLTENSSDIYRGNYCIFIHIGCANTYDAHSKKLSTFFPKSVLNN